MNVVFQIDGRDAIPVRAVLSVTCGSVTPQRLALHLSKPSKPDSERPFSAYTYSQGQVVLVSAERWGMPNELLTSIARKFKSAEPKFQNPERDQHREASWQESLKALPHGVFVWLDELKKWYDEKPRYSPHSVWEEQHRVIDEDEDPAPQFLLKNQTDTLDLYPIGMTHCEELIHEGFAAWLDNRNDSLNMATVAHPKTEHAKSQETPAPVGVDGDGLAPLATAPAWSLISSLSRAPGYRWPLYQFLKAAHAAGEPCPKARDVLEGWKLNTPPELEVMTDGVKFNDGLGNPKEADLKAIQQAIKNLLN